MSGYKRFAILLLLLMAFRGAQAGQTELLAAYAQLEDHINGVTTLTASEINAQATIISGSAGNAGDNTTMITASFDLVETYESVVGPLFQNGATSADGGFSRTDTSTANKALALAMLEVYQAIIDDAYNTWNLNNSRAALDGAKFESADYWPGAVTPPADPSAVYSVQINASQPKAWGYPVQFMEEPARRPTGAYLAPGSIATVTVPEALVNKGFEVRVGAHVADLSNKSMVKRIDRVSKTYAITSTSTEVANPLGGGIYIEVPYEVEEGIVTVEIQNAVRSPFYSNTAHRQTSLSDWQNTERNYPGPWADFESDKFMLNVPTSWIYAYDDPVTMMADWDKAMDACSDLQGLPRIRPKTVLYCQIDVLIDAAQFSPGYPQSNHSYNPHSTFYGDVDNEYLNGPKFAGYQHLHELGHAMFITKFRGEVEALVNFPYVPVHNQYFDVSLDEAFGRSIGDWNARNISRDQAALSWILSENFQAGNEMDYSNTTLNQFKYQHRGYAKYADIAGLFGWEALSNFWHSVAVDYENGIEYARNTDPVDSRILRMSRAAGADLTPLIHFWGIHPVDAGGLKTDILSERIPKSALVYDRLVHYQSIVPMDAAGFEAHYQIFKAAGIKDSESDWYQTNRTAWDSTLGALTVSRVQDILDEYFPNGRPASGEVQSLPYAESFEDGIGEWVQSTDDDLDWTVYSGATETANTGPSGASDGDQYLYIEFHDSSVQYKTAMVECSFDLSQVDTAELSFDYHMYGTQIDYLSVDVFDGTAWSSNVWNKTGQQHFSSDDAWSTAAVDLSAFAGNEFVTVRFRGKQKQWHAADMAIDKIRVEGSSGSVRQQAEDFAVTNGVLVGACSDSDGGELLGFIEDGDWSSYTNIYFGDNPNADIPFKVRISSNTDGGDVQLRLGSETGELIGTVAVSGTGGWDNYATFSTTLSGISGMHDLYLVYTGGVGYLMNLNWFEWTPGTQSALQSSLVAEWTFDFQTLENSGSSGSIHDGTFMNSTGDSFYSADTPDGSGWSLKLDSIADGYSETPGGEFLRINNSAAGDAGYVDTFDTSAYTVSMWVKTDGDWSQWDEFGGKGSESAASGWSLRARLFGTHDLDGLRFNSYADGCNALDGSPYDVNLLDQQWHLMTVAYDGSEMKLYLDTTLVASVAGAAISDTSPYALVFGARDDGSRGEDILIDSIRFYNSALSAQDVDVLFAVGSGVHDPEFVSGASVSNGNFHIQFSGTVGQHYRLEYIESLTSSNGWQVVTDMVSLATSPAEVSAPMTNSAGFYRMRWLP